MHKGIPVEYCSGSGKYANLFGVSLSTAERLTYQHAGCVGRHGIAITHQSGRRFSVNQAAKSWRAITPGFDDADIALANAADSKMCLRNISSAELRLLPMPTLGCEHRQIDAPSIPDVHVQAGRRFSLRKEEHERIMRTASGLFSSKDAGPTKTGGYDIHV